GYVTACDCLELGLCGVAMGAGRTRADQKVDPAVGIELAKKPGDRVKRGETLALLHVQSKVGADKHATRVRAAFSVGKQAPKASPILIERIAR
ncbi:MAG TPA: thymidine phosphorylase, partial [Polyangiaceae bacterium]|nr:thymidine phosphorylase [Polyangiaceae bacterium]